MLRVSDGRIYSTDLWQEPWLRLVVHAEHSPFPSASVPLSGSCGSSGGGIKNYSHTGKKRYTCMPCVSMHALLVAEPDSGPAHPLLTSDSY